MNTTKMVVADKVTTRTIHVFADQMKTAFADQTTVTLDIDAVADVDLSFLQLIEAARRETATTGHTLHLDRPANAVVTALMRRAGFLTDPTPEDIDFWFHGALPQ